MADFPIVGIGSSAGGLEALQKLFSALPEDCGLGFVVAAHLDPTQKSHLSELLGRCTRMPVVPIESAVKVEANHVYVIGPDQELAIEQGVVSPLAPTAPRGQRHPVDYFFRSLAEDQGEGAIGIVLSGTGTNGSLGLRFIKAEGGIAIAQDPETAGFQGMPRSALGTGIIDVVLPPEEMPEALLGLARHFAARGSTTTNEEVAPEEQLQTLLALVRAQTRQDFSGYRKKTLQRRIHRRMGLHRIDSLQHYIERLRGDPDEIKALTADLTINVTGFFRDPEAWEALAQQVIMPLVRERPGGSTIRIWVPGCSTGEEAYSAAMLIDELAEHEHKDFELRLFATDVAAGVLGPARAGLYPGSIALDIGEERLQRFFEHEDDTYRIRTALREAITFAPQNLLQDPPFSRLDLIICRNLLIYIEPEVQKRLIGLFHFALRQGGHLFLGSAEGLSGQDDLFQPVSKKWRIYRRLGASHHDVAHFPLVEAIDPTLRDGQNGRRLSAEPVARSLEQMAQALAERYAPASALIDARCRVYYLHGPTEDYLRPPRGEPSSNLLDMAREGLQLPLRSAIRKAVEQGQEVTAAARVRRSVEPHPVRIVVTPLRSVRGTDLRLLVGFFEQEAAPELAATLELEDQQAAGQLQADLDHTREDLRLSIEQVESANEELKASNEEIRSINEELQASNEELETSKEELQSLNEELNTVNHQLEAKVGELEARTDDLNNLLNSTELAVLFLDRNFCIRWFTTPMKALLELLPSDIGRPIAHFAQKFTGGDLLEDARRVLERLLPVDAEIVDELGRWYIRRGVPYRTGNDRIDGVVMTFTEISERKQHEQEVEEGRKYAEQIVEAIPFPLMVLTPDLRVRSANQAFYATFQVSPDTTVGRALEMLGNRQWDIPELRPLLLSVLPERKEIAGFEMSHDFEEIGPRTMLLHACPLDGEQLILFGMVDITERKRNEQERELLALELSHRVKNVFAVIQALATQTNGDKSVDVFKEVFLGRLHTLASAHGILLETQWQGADLKTLLEHSMAAFQEDNPDLIKLEGEPLRLNPQQTLGLSLVMHELGTNAAKYGALSDRHGHVRVAWRTEGNGKDARVRLIWQEQDGPVVTPPSKQGFGSKLIEQICSHQLGGQVERQYAHEGLTCEIEFPLA